MIHKVWTFPLLHLLEPRRNSRRGKIKPAAELWISELQKEGAITCTKRFLKLQKLYQKCRQIWCCRLKLISLLHTLQKRSSEYVRNSSPFLFTSRWCVHKRAGLKGITRPGKTRVPTLICNFENMTKFSQSRNSIVSIFDGSQDCILKDDCTFLWCGKRME